MRAVYEAGFVLLVLASSCGGGGASSPAPVTPPPPPPASVEPSPAPPANPDAAAVEAARPSLRACYEKARTASPALGRTTITFSLRVDETGRVTTVNLEYKHKLDEASKACMRDAAFAIKLPPGAPRRAEVPLTFEPR